jgi:polyphenol oxidase
MTLTEAASLRPVAGLTLLTWDVLAGAEAYVTTRAGGVSSGPYESLNLSLAVGDDRAAVLENRRRLATAIGASPADLTFSRQVHGVRARAVDAASRGTGAFTHDESVPEGDILVTTDPSAVLAVLAADCVPIVLHDPMTGVLGCVHAGWRGTVAKAAAAGVGAMASLGASPARIVACLGPAIGADRYQVGAEVAGAARTVFGESAALFLRADGPQRFRFDLVAANRLVLRAAGLASGNIHATTHVTGDGMFFSDRSARPCGRLALVARLRRDSAQ